VSELPDYEIIKTFKGGDSARPKDCLCKGGSKPDEHVRLALDLDKNKDYPHVMAGITVLREVIHKAKKYNYKLCVQNHYLIRFKDVELTLDEILVSSKIENHLKDKLNDKA
jgi:hypothetical protein